MAEQRSDQPTHWLTQTRTYDDGYNRRHVSASHHLTAVEAQESRVRRLKDSGIRHASGPGWVSYREDQPGIPADLRCDIRLEWTDSNPEG